MLDGATRVLTGKIKTLVKMVAEMSGLDMERESFEVRLTLSKKRFFRQGYKPLEGYDVSRHYGDQDMDPSYQYVQEGFISARIKFINDALGEGEIRRSTFADIGDSNGIFLRSLGKKGTSINISQTVLDNISDLDVLLGALPSIPLPSKSIDYVLCFETVEHLQDPIGGLRELARLSRKGVFVSVPFVSRTNIHPYWPDKSRPPTEQHVLECSDEDFRKLLTYAGLNVASTMIHEVFDYPRTLREVLADLAWKAVNRDILCGVFRKFSIYFLVSEEDGRRQ